MLAATAGFGLAALGLLTWRSLGMSLGLGAGAVLYGMTLAVSGICSLVYNVWFHSRPKTFWRLADHIAIFLLIAGTYTPLSIGSADGRIAWMLGPIWTVAAIGILLKIALGSRYERLFILFYLAMGWMVLTGLGGMIASFEPAVIGLVLAGGLAFSIGTIFHAMGHRWPWGKPAWHGFVLVGCATHFVAIFAFVLPMG